MSSPLISIIVPVYNSEKYLQECIDSILQQSFKDFELILVNDGSTDSSPDICREVSRKDSRIKFITKENGGVSSARNKGIEIATGKYITFIDSDDLVDKEYLDKMVCSCNNGVDFVQSGLYFFDNASNNLIGKEILTNDYFDRSKPYDSFKLATIPLITSPVAKIYCREIICKQNIKFNLSLSYGEDRDFNLQYIQFISKATSISYAGYYYRKGLEDSLSCDSDCIKLLKCDLAYWDKLKQYLQSTPYEGDVINAYLANRLFNFYNDRLIQYSKSGPAYYNLNKVIRQMMDTERYDWLCQHTGSINCGKILKTIYHIKSPIVLTAFLKLTV